MSAHDDPKLSAFLQSPSGQEAQRIAREMFKEMGSAADTAPVAMSDIDHLRASYNAALQAATKRAERAERTVASLACMLGWENVPPQETLERSVAALNVTADTLRTRLAEVEAREARLTQAATELLDGMGIELDDERLSYVAAQLGREDIADLRAALRNETAPGEQPAQQEK